MHPFLFQIGNRPVVPTYGVFAALAIIASYFLIKRIAPIDGLSPKKTAEGIVFIACFGILTAKVMEVFVSWRKIVDDPKQLILILLFSGGVFLGGVIGAIAFAPYWMKRMGITFRRGFDMLVLVGCMSMVVARWGCFFSGCCWGAPTTMPWGVTYPEIAHKLHAGIPHEPVHPTQIYLVMLSFVLLVFLLWLFKNRTFYGQVGFTYLMGYAAGRFIIEFFRGDAERGFVAGGALSTSQALAIPMFLGGGIALFYYWRRHKLSGEADWKPGTAPLEEPAKKLRRAR